jgi:hypothetical protein
MIICACYSWGMALNIGLNVSFDLGTERGMGGRQGKVSLRLTN